MNSFSIKLINSNTSSKTDIAGIYSTNTELLKIVQSKNLYTEPQKTV